MSTVVGLQVEKKRLEKKKYAKLVLDTFNRLERDDKKRLEETRSEVERKARKAL